MNAMGQLYRHSLTLLTDLYELTMAQGYWKLARHEEHAAFALLFRRQPFQSGYTVVAGLAYAADYIENLRFGADDLAYLGGLEGNDGRPLFEKGFLDYLGALRLSLSVDAMPEGTAAFSQQPLVRVTGPILQCQIVESAVLNAVNFQTLLATKAARVCQAAEGQPVLEFGLRRAQGIDGALAASRAAYIGGCAATSNVLAGKLFGIPVKGTHAHSWVMLFDSEKASFQAYAQAMPNNCIFLVDTYDTLQGVRNAIEVGRRLRRRGHEMIGVRLDSGDLAYLSTEARKMLDEAGFADAAIVASNDLDEHVIASLKRQGAPVGVWGVGTKLVTAHDDPALGGVYKLTAVRTGGRWAPRLKLSEQPAKISTPGVLQVRRFLGPEGFLADMIYDTELGVPSETVIVDPVAPSRRRSILPDQPYRDLLVPVFRDGRRVGADEPLEAIRRRAAENVAALHPGIRRFMNPHEYPAGLAKNLHDLRMRMVLAARGQEDPPAGGPPGSTS
jgi:nicotinate phosphoribosyltransferase